MHLTTYVAALKSYTNLLRVVSDCDFVMLQIKAFDFAEREKVRMSQLQGVERVRNKFAQVCC